MVTLTAIVLFGAIARAQGASYFISASGPLGSGSGSSAANAADASSAAKHDAIVNGAVPGTTIQYGPGTFLTNGGLDPADNVIHQGAGYGNTTVMVKNGATNAGSTSIWNFGRGNMTGVAWYDMTIDFNPTNQTWWGKTAGGNTGAICMTCATNCTIQRCNFIHAANAGANNESFIISIGIVGNTGSGELKNVLIDSCIFQDAINDPYSDGGCSFIYMMDSQPVTTIDVTTCIVNKCQFLNMKYPEYTHLVSAQGVTAPTVTNCYMSGCDTLFYLEPGSQSLGNNTFLSSGQTANITGNTVVNGGYVARLFMHNDGVFAGNLNISNNVIGMCTDPYQGFGQRFPAGLEIVQYQGAPAAPIGNVTIGNNTFHAPSPAQSNSEAVSWGGICTIANLTIQNNQLEFFTETGNANTGSGVWGVSPSHVLATYINSGNAFVTTAYNPTSPPTIVSPPSAPLPTPTSGPYNGTAASVPGSVYASNYDLGGQGVGYSDSIGADPGAYRTDGVDLKTTSDTPVGTGYVLGWRTTVEWTNYTVNVTKAASYAVSARVESASNTGQFHINVDGKTVIPTVTVPLTGPWDTASSWKTMNLGSIPLTAGKHVVQVYVDAPWFDLNYLTFVATSTPSPNDTIVTTVGPSITDSALNVWKLTSSAQVSLNGTVISYTANVVEVAYVSGTVWQLNASGNWYSFTPKGALGTGPTITSPLPTSA